MSNYNEALGSRIKWITFFEAIITQKRREASGCVVVLSIPCRFSNNICPIFFCSALLKITSSLMFFVVLSGECLKHKSFCLEAWCTSQVEMVLSCKKRKPTACLLSWWTKNPWWRITKSLKKRKSLCQQKNIYI